MQRRPRRERDERNLPAPAHPVLPWLGDAVNKSTTASTDAETHADTSTDGDSVSSASTGHVSDADASTPRTSAASASSTHRDPFALDELMTTSDPAHDVVVANRDSERREVTLFVTAQDRRDVRYAGTHVVAPDVERVLLDTSDLDPDGIETFHVVVETSTHAIDSRLRTNDCHGDLRVVVRDDGDLHAVRSIA